MTSKYYKYKAGKKFFVGEECPWDIIAAYVQGDSNMCKNNVQDDKETFILQIDQDVQDSSSWERRQRRKKAKKLKKDKKLKKQSKVK